MDAASLDWTETDLSRELGGGVESDLTRALAPLTVVALTERRGDAEVGWGEVVRIGRHLRDLIDIAIPVLDANDDRPHRADLVDLLTVHCGDRKTAEAFTLWWYRSTRERPDLRSDPEASILSAFDAASAALEGA